MVILFVGAVALVGSKISRFSLHVLNVGFILRLRAAIPGVLRRRRNAGGRSTCKANAGDGSLDGSVANSLRYQLNTIDVFLGSLGSLGLSTSKNLTNTIQYPFHVNWHQSPPAGIPSYSNYRSLRIHHAWKTSSEETPCLRKEWLTVSYHTAKYSKIHRHSPSLDQIFTLIIPDQIYDVVLPDFVCYSF